jgi:tRNA G18 (ribose-2'-O)-methylase SpoU
MDVGGYEKPAVLLLGGERSGLTREQADLCELLLRLPMGGRITSLNLGVATGVMLYAMREKFQVDS